MDWYEKNIEAGVRDAVRLLRDNGINTTYSCHHAMVIEAENYEDSEIQHVYNLLVENGHDGFIIQMVYCKDKDGPLHRCLEIYLNPQSRNAM